MNGVIIPVGGSGWIELNTNIKYKVVNGIVYVYIANTGTASGWATLGTLPSQYAPDFYVYNGAYLNAAVFVAPTGLIQANSQTSVPTMISYPIKSE